MAESCAALLVPDILLHPVPGEDLEDVEMTLSSSEEPGPVTVQAGLCRQQERHDFSGSGLGCRL